MNLFAAMDEILDEKIAYVKVSQQQALGRNIDQWIGAKHVASLFDELGARVAVEMVMTKEFAERETIFLSFMMNVLAICKATQEAANEVIPSQE